MDNKTAFEYSSTHAKTSLGEGLFVIALVVMAAIGAVSLITLAFGWVHIG